MKQAKKILALVLVAMMVLSLSVTAFADDPDPAAQTNLTVSVKSQYQTRTYKAYQIFKGNIDTNTDADTSTDVYDNSNTRKLSNIAWADDVNSTAILTALKANTGFTGKIVDALGTGKNGEDVKTAEDVAKVLAKITDTDTLIAIAKIFAANKASTAKGTSTTATVIAGTDPVMYKHNITGLSAGYYIIVDETAVQNTDTAASAILLNVVGNTSVTEKVVKPSVDKEVQDNETEATDDEWGKTADHAIGESFQFKLTATLPQDVDYNAYATYLTKFVDTPSTGITFEEIVSVTVSGKNASGTAASVTVDPFNETSAPNGYKLVNNLTLNNGDGTKTIEIEITDLKTTASTIDLSKGDTTITVIYKAHLNTSADVTPVGGNTTTNNNKVKLTYSNNPTGNGTGTTPEETVWVFTYTIENTKWAGPGTKVEQPENVTITGTEKNLNTFGGDSWVDKTNNKYYSKSGDDWYVMDSLPNAGFKLYSDSNCTNEIQLIYDESISAYRKVTGSETGVEMKSASGTGVFNIKGLDVGTYYLKETTTPDGYNTIKPITITIGATHKLAETSDDITGPTLSVGDPYVNLSETATDNEIVDNSGTVLPSTGGIGTTIFYVVGGLLVLVAGVMLITKRRMTHEE